MCFSLMNEVKSNVSFEQNGMVSDICITITTLGESVIVAYSLHTVTEAPQEARSDYNHSRVYRNKQYYVSKRHEPFNLAKMKGRCKELGEYLVQVDDKDEHFRVADIVRSAGGFRPFDTGMTDKGSGGHFYNYNDKTPAKYLRWRWFQPDNWYGENCVTIWRTGLNDRGCGKRCRYICEVPR
ncbi:collectin-12 [Plakobranchus ocellatus]|uniref:Collectin-12 n=1 Tax=Plakobranchus ocellatus TaxID=259542 RepID=A0AAV3YSS9_9GAST|nr:collectin-12 [Plakobranchus ocellatus]